MGKLTRQPGANTPNAHLACKCSATAGILLRFVACLALLAIFTGTRAFAQQGTTAGKSERKLVTRIEPDYPAVLRARQIGGTVRLDVTITPKGTVKSVALIGGNPILAEAAIAAVKRWTYAPGDGTSSALVSLEFNPYR